jgi:DNA-binding transcriptional MerR regulator
MAYTVKQAAELAALSVSGVKTYGVRYGTLLSPSANPGPGLSRSYTPEDVAKLRMIGRLAKEGTPHSEILSRLESGESDPLPQDAPQDATDGPQAPAPLILVRDAMSALQDALQAERAERQELAQRLQDAEIRAARLEAELTATRRPFWKRLFG